MQKTLRQHLEMVYKSRISAGNLCCTVSQERFLARKMRIRTMSIIPGVECCATFQAALYIETHSMMDQSEFDAANIALSRAADKRKSLINIHKNRYTATLSYHMQTVMICNRLFMSTLTPLTIAAVWSFVSCTHLYSIACCFLRQSTALLSPRLAENITSFTTSRTAAVQPSFRDGVALAASTRKSSSVFLNDSIKHFLISLSMF